MHQKCPVQSLASFPMAYSITMCSQEPAVGQHKNLMALSYPVSVMYTTRYCIVCPLWQPGLLYAVSHTVEFHPAVVLPSSEAHD